MEGGTMGTDVRAHLDRIDDQGYTIVEKAIDLDLVDALSDDLLRLEKELGIVAADNAFEGTHTVRIYNLLAHGRDFEQVPVHPAILPICEGVLDEGLLVSSLSSIAIGPDESPDLLRQYDSIPAEMDKGSVLVWHGSLWHGGGANTTDSRRVGIAMNYCAGYIRQQENQQLGLPVATVRQFPPRLQQLVGYGIYRGLIGHIDKNVPSNLLLEARDDAHLLWDYATPPKD